MDTLNISHGSHGSHGGTVWEAVGKAEALLRVEAVPPMALGEAIPTKRSRLVETLKLPDMAALDASAHRLELLGRLGNDCAAMALDAAASIEAGNSLEKMLAHQLAVAHKTALQLTDKATFQRDPEEKAQSLHLAGRMMETFQHGLLTLERLRKSDGRYINLTVADGGQAVVIVGIYKEK